MPFHKTFGVDLGTSMVKIYSCQQDTILTEKNMIAIRNGHRFWPQAMMLMRFLKKTPQMSRSSLP